MQELKIKTEDLRKILALPDVQLIYDFLGRYANRLLIVGGAVRDTLVGKFSPDIDVDFAVNAPAKAVSKYLKTRFQIPRYKCIWVDSHFLNYGTIKLTIADKVYDLTMFRSDRYIKSTRHPTVKCTNDIRVDVLRRDFTVNGLYINGMGKLMDPTKKGVDDLEKKRIRFIIDEVKPVFTKVETVNTDVEKEHEKKSETLPNTEVVAVVEKFDADAYFKSEVFRRINEDPLRIVRYVRMYLKFFPREDLNPNIVDKIKCVQDVMDFCGDLMASFLQYDPRTILVLMENLPLLRNVSVNKLKLEVAKIFGGIDGQIK